MRRNRIVAVILVCAAFGFTFIYFRYLRSPAHIFAALTVSTPKQTEAATCRIASSIQSLEGGLNLTINPTDMTFSDSNHKLSVSWEYHGGWLDRDYYLFTTTFDGINHSRMVFLDSEPVTLLSQKGYRLTLYPDRSDF